MNHLNRNDDQQTAAESPRRFAGRHMSAAMALMMAAMIVAMIVVMA